MIRIIAVGRRHEGWIAEGLERYQKRLKKPFDVEWVLLPHSSRDGQEARQIESSAILSRIKPDDFTILLDEKGLALDSPTLSSQLSAQLESSRPVSVIVGGAYGVNNEVYQRANLVWSLSPLVFPHQMVRLILIEQLYRAQEIAADNPYHHI